MNFSNPSAKVLISIQAFLFLASLGTQAYAKNVDEVSIGIVMIEKVEGFGAGILVGNDQESVFIATAYHNIWQSGKTDSPYEKLQVIVFKAQDAIVHGTADPTYRDQSVDLGVVTVPLAEVERFLPSGDESLEYGDASGLSRGDEVFTVGYNDLIRWNSPAFKPVFHESWIERFQIEAANVTTGSSGGGVFDERGHLIGMINSKSSNVRMNCFHIKHIITYFESHGLPTNLLRKAPGHSVQISPEGGTAAEEAVNTSVAGVDGEPNNVSTQAVPLIFGKSVEGRVSSSDVEDWYIVIPPKNGIIRLSIQNLHKDKEVQKGRLGAAVVFSSTKKKLGHASKYGGIRPTMSEESKPIAVNGNEKYFIQVKSHRGVNTAPYRLLVVFEP